MIFAREAGRHSVRTVTASAPSSCSKTAKEKLFNMVKTGSSYCSQSELPIVFGLGAPEEGRTLSLEITWPGGAKDTIYRPIKPNQSLTIQEGKGIIATAPIVFARPSPTPAPTPQASPQ